ncbi:integrase [Mycobacteroides abscessus]|uniref:integrase n=1 Tax=Mycobacteroides abscessus TaxID=36809 RepID=UPI001F1BEF48|nr:integrase [Mycobacteroides abscessus]MDO3333062.1 integrase [Mycobacteroides abscessus subsp. bolletii]
MWDAASALPRRPNVQPSQMRLVFPGHPAWSLRSREIAMALLNTTDPRLLARSVSFGSRTFSLGHVRGRVEAYRVVANWQIANDLPDDITAWSDQDWVALVDNEISRGMKDGTIRNLVCAVRDLIALSPILTGGGLAADPWKGKPTKSIAKHAEKRSTQVIEPARWIPLIDTCWKYISVFAEDILSLRHTHDCALRVGMPEGDRRPINYTDLLTEYLETNDAVIPIEDRTDGSVEPDWSWLSRLASADQSRRIFFSSRIKGRDRRQMVYDAIGNAELPCRVLTLDELRSKLATHVADMKAGGRSTSRLRAASADQVLHDWIERSRDGVALRATNRSIDSEQITARDINWAMMERTVYGFDLTTNLLRGTGEAVWRRRELVLAEAQRGRTFIADKGSMSTPRPCTNFVPVEDSDGNRMPWREALSDFEARCELRALRAACYIFIAAMTMMRDSEIQDIQRGSVTTFYGVPAVRSHTYKGRTAKTPAHWWIVEEVATAIAVLERLSTHPHYLFARFVDGYHENPEPGIKVGREIDFFLEHLKSTGARSGLPPIPDGSSISPRTLRRTTACISRELGGNELAVSQQLKHVINYGYSNVTAAYMAPDPAWAKFLGTNRSEDNLGHMVSMIQESLSSTHPLAGRGGERLTNAMVSAAEAGPRAAAQSLLMSDSQIGALLKKHAPAIHFGPANACLYDEETALCRRQASTQTPGPLLGLCQPARCANSVIGLKHLPVWISELQTLKSTIAAKGVSPPRRQALSERLADVHQVLTQADVDTDRCQ